MEAIFAIVQCVKITFLQSPEFPEAEEFGAFINVSNNHTLYSGTCGWIGPQGLSPPHATLAPQQSRAKRRLTLPLVGRLPTSLVGPVSRLPESSWSDKNDDAWLQQELKSAAQTTKTATTSHRRPLSVAQVFQIAIPAVAVGLCWPVLSMQDTSAVGRGVAGTVAQAALHPAIAVLNYSSKLLVSDTMAKRE